MSEVGSALRADPRELRRIWRLMRHNKPHLYVVLKAWVEGMQLRDERTQYSSGLYRGFYSELARRLGVSENAVKYRLKAAMQWFARRLENLDLER